MCISWEHTPIFPYPHWKILYETLTYRTLLLTPAPIHIPTCISGTLSTQPEGPLLLTGDELVNITCTLNHTTASQMIARFYYNTTALLCGSATVNCNPKIGKTSAIFRIFHREYSGDFGFVFAEYILEVMASRRLNGAKFHCSSVCGITIHAIGPQVTIMVQGTLHTLTSGIQFVLWGERERVFLFALPTPETTELTPTPTTPTLTPNIPTTTPRPTESESDKGTETYMALHSRLANLHLMHANVMYVIVLRVRVHVFHFHTAFAHTHFLPLQDSHISKVAAVW